MQPAPSFDFQFQGGKTQYIRALSPVPCSLKVFCFVLLREVVVEIVFLIVFEAAADQPRSGASNENLDKSVEELELSVRSYNCLKNANIRTIRELVLKTEAEMLKTKNFGRKSLNEIKEILHTMGLSLGMRVDQPAAASQE